MPANVNHIESILSTIAEITQVSTNTASAASEAQNKAQKISDETEREEKNSKQKLEQAKQAEKAAKQAHEAAKAGVAAAQAAVAVAMAAVPFSAPALAAAQQALTAAKTLEKTTYLAYQAAQAHRKLMELRYSLAQTCRMRAAAMLGKLVGACVKCVPKVESLTMQTVSRLKAAKGDLDQFQSHSASAVNISVPQSKSKSPPTQTAEIDNRKNSPKQNVNVAELGSTGKQSEEYRKWRDYKASDDVIRPDTIRERLNPSEDVRIGLLRDKYEHNPRFRQQVDNFRKKLASGDPQQIEYVRNQSKKNMAGQLGEDIIKEGLAPLADNVSTQVHQDLKDGSYTKIDITLDGLKKPTIFGKGEGMGAREGSNVAIEVKAGKENYLRKQKKHLEKQVTGHKDYDVSLIMCSRDIKDISGEQSYREDIKDTGSHAIGMLPRKEDIDSVVWRFLNEDPSQFTTT